MWIPRGKATALSNLVCYRFAYEKAARAVKSKLPEPVEARKLHLRPAYARISNHQPINRAALIRQSQSRYYSTARSSTRVGAQAFQGSKIREAVSRLTTRSPFASTLRPNLTGGTFCRTAGGYAIGAGRIGGARYFSSSPAAPAQVVQNVSAAVRAFWLSGNRARFDGINKRTGSKQYKVVTPLQDEATRKMYAAAPTAPGAYVEFELSPMISAFDSLVPSKKQTTETVSGFEPITLNSDNLMELLSVDFGRALREFTTVLNDLKKLSTLGDLPISLRGRSTIHVRFPGCDAESVERLCNEIDMQRGVIRQDEDFETRNGTEIALLFPFAPSHSGTEEELFSIHGPMSMSPSHQLDWRNMISSEDTKESADTHSPEMHDYTNLDQNPWATPSSGYSSINISELGDRVFFPDLSNDPIQTSNSNYEGVEGIYKFIEECDRARR